jgi:hypothetical protein
MYAKFSPAKSGAGSPFEANLYTHLPKTSLTLPPAPSLKQLREGEQFHPITLIL